MRFIDRLMYIEKETGMKFVYDDETRVLTNRPSQIIRETHPNKFKLAYPHELEEGDEVRVRQWEEMAEYYGEDRGGDIPVPASFVREMRDLCGKSFTVQKVHSYGNFPTYYLKDSYGEGVCRTFTNEMLIKVEGYRRF